MNQPYSEPKIFTGGVSITQWKDLSSVEKKLALSKEWFVYYSYRDPESGKLKRQSHIKAGANRHKNMRARLSVLKTLQRNLFLLLENGFDPYEDNTANKERFLGKTIKVIEPTVTVIAPPTTTGINWQQVETNEMSITEAFKFGLEIKKRELNSNS